MCSEDRVKSNSTERTETEKFLGKADKDSKTDYVGYTSYLQWIDHYFFTNLFS